jgi:flagellar basal body-associated protein FliL
VYSELTSTKRRILLIALILFLVTLAFVIYLYCPIIISWQNPQEGIDIVDVKYPNNAHRTQELPVFVSIINVGESAKDVLVEVSSKDSPTITNGLKT